MLYSRPVPPVSLNLKYNLSLQIHVSWSSSVANQRKLLCLSLSGNISASFFTDPGRFSNGNTWPNDQFHPLSEIDCWTSCKMNNYCALPVTDLLQTIDFEWNGAMEFEAQIIVLLWFVNTNKTIGHNDIEVRNCKEKPKQTGALKSYELTTDNSNNRLGWNKAQNTARSLEKHGSGLFPFQPVN